MQYDSSIGMDTNVNLNSIPSYEINTESIEKLREMTAKMEKALAASINIESIKESMELLNTVMKDRFSKLSPMLEQYNFEEALNGIRYSFAEMADAIGLKNIEILQNIDFSRVFKDSFYRERYDEASQMAFDYVKEEIKVKRILHKRNFWKFLMNKWRIKLAGKKNCKINQVNLRKSIQFFINSSHGFLMFFFQQ